MSAVDARFVYITGGFYNMKMNPLPNCWRYDTKKEAHLGWELLQPLNQARQRHSSC